MPCNAGYEPSRVRRFLFCCHCHKSTRRRQMGLMDILQQYTNAAAPNHQRAHEDFEQVSASAPRETLGQGVGDAFRSDDTPPFGEMVSHLFARSNPDQKAGVLNQLLRSVGPGVLSSLGGGLLGGIAPQANAGVPHVTPEAAEQLSPDDVKKIAERAELHDPSVLDKVGSFYAGHP